jgi:hypothetical protein
VIGSGFSLDPETPAGRRVRRVHKIWDSHRRKCLGSPHGHTGRGYDATKLNELGKEKMHTTYKHRHVLGCPCWTNMQWFEVPVESWIAFAGDSAVWFQLNTIFTQVSIICSCFRRNSHSASSSAFASVRNARIQTCSPRKVPMSESNGQTDGAIAAIDCLNYPLATPLPPRPPLPPQMKAVSLRGNSRRSGGTRPDKGRRHLLNLQGWST